MPGSGPRADSGRRRGESALVAESTEPEGASPELSGGRSHGRGVRLRRGVQDARPRCREAGHRGGDDDVAGLVAGRLRPLRAVVHPDGVAQRGHLPHPRRPRRRRLRHAALRAPQLLARQREPRQGAPAAVADQAEVRPEDLVGRPDDPRGQLRAGVDGAQDVRLRRRPRGRLGARGGHQLGAGDRVARRRALQRRPRSRQPARRRPDGPDLRESRGAQRQSGSGCRRPGHPGDVRSDGDERRGDGRPHRGGAHVRQDARRRRCGPARGSRARGRRHRGAGPRLDEHLRQRQGRRRDHQRAGGRLDAHPDHLGQQLLRDPVRLRVGAEQEPRGGESVGAEGWRGRGQRAGCPRFVEAAHAGHADDRPRVADGPDLRAHIEALPPEPGRVRGCVRPGVVQADAPRHGAGLALPRPGGSRRAAPVAGPACPPSITS